MTQSTGPIKSDAVSTFPPGMQLFLMTEGAVGLIALVAVAELGIADLLKESPCSSGELARAASAHPQALYRVLRLLSSMGVFAEVEPDQFALTPVGELLRSDVPGSMRSWVRMCGLPVWWRFWGESLHSIRTGEPVMKRVLGIEFFEYFAAHPEEGEIFDRAMMDFGRGVTAAVIQAYDFTGFRQVMDVGGGRGDLITGILQANPEMTGVLFDLPQAAGGARAAIADAGLSNRCQIVEGNFFESVPPGADAYLLRMIIHDWDHDRAVAILKNCRAAVREGSRLLLVENVLRPGNDIHPGKFLDIVMLVTLGGQERTDGEYRELLAEAGFRMTRVVPTNSPMSVIETVPQ